MFVHVLLQVHRLSVTGGQHAESCTVPQEALPVATPSPPSVRHPAALSSPASEGLRGSVGTRGGFADLHLKALTR